MAKKKIETIIKEKISPFTLNEGGKSNIAQLVRKYEYNFLLDCIDIGVKQYLRYDAEGNPTKESVENFINKLGGIAYNRSLDPVESEINHIKNKINNSYAYWNKEDADCVLHDYVAALRNANYSKSAIILDLQNDMVRLVYKCRSWSQLYDGILKWIDDIKSWTKDENSIKDKGSILPEPLYNRLPNNIRVVCKQINSSYENNLFDCCAVMMRRLMEGLLVQSYQNNNIESEITDEKTGRHIVLDKIIKNAINNATLALSVNTKKELIIFKDLGNYSAHKIWYNCTKQDIQPHAISFRVIIEELLHKAGLS